MNIKVKSKYKIIASILTLAAIIYVLLVVKINNIDLILSPQKITPLSPLYYLKSSREFIQSFFIFGEEDTANWHLTLAQKKAYSSKLLHQRGFSNLSRSHYHQAQVLQYKSLILIDYLSDKTNTTYLQDKYNINQDILASIDSE